MGLKGDRTSVLSNILDLPTRRIPLRNTQLIYPKTYPSQGYPMTVPTTRTHAQEE
ncbi:hypothetical protein Hanom_Chr10g00916261 [Helianthus anomalus]